MMSFHPWRTRICLTTLAIALTLGHSLLGCASRPMVGDSESRSAEKTSWFELLANAKSVQSVADYAATHAKSLTYDEACEWYAAAVYHQLRPRSGELQLMPTTILWRLTWHNPDLAAEVATNIMLEDTRNSLALYFTWEVARVGQSEFGAVPKSPASIWAAAPAVVSLWQGPQVPQAHMIAGYFIELSLDSFQDLPSDDDLLAYIESTRGIELPPDLSAEIRRRYSPMEVP